MRHDSRATLTDLWHSACETSLFSPRAATDVMMGLTACIYDCVLEADSMAFDFDIGRDLWLTKLRWPKLQRDYLPPGEVTPFLERCEAIARHAGKRGTITQLLCRRAVNQRNGEEQHVWGNCMLALTYRGGKNFLTPTMTLHSRVSYIAYLGSMDLAVAWVLAREIARRSGFEVEDMAFRWHLDSMQWHGMKSVPYVISQGWQEEIMDKDKWPMREYPTIHMTRRCIDLMERDLQAGKPTDKAHMKYGPARRMNIRYRRVMGSNPLPSIPVSSLTLLKELL